MADKSSTPEVIDSDGHVIEPDTVWSEYAEPEFRDCSHPGGRVRAGDGDHARLPRHAGVVPRGQGEDHWEAVAEDTDWEEESKHKMARPGGYDPVARLVDMDAEGIDVAVLYPTAMLTWIEEADIFGAACRAYNNWLHDYCSAGPDRLYPVALVPLQDPDAAVARCGGRSSELGAKAVMIRPARVHRRAASSTIPPTTRSGPRRADSTARSACTRHPTATWPTAAGCSGSPTASINPTEGLALRQGLTNAFDLQMAVAYFVLGGICERHPDLRVAFLEGTGGWIVPMLQRFDHQFEIFGSSDQSTLPSEVFARQCMISFDPDEVALAFTAEHLGADKILWASDYPHPDAKIPGVVAELMDAVKPLPDESQRQIVGATARTFYKL